MTTELGEAQARLAAEVAQMWRDVPQYEGRPSAYFVGTDGNAHLYHVRALGLHIEGTPIPTRYDVDDLINEFLADLKAARPDGYSVVWRRHPTLGLDAFGEGPLEKRWKATARLAFLPPGVEPDVHADEAA